MRLLAMLAGIGAMASFGSGCGDEAKPESEPATADAPASPASRLASDCAIGEEPSYTVPHDPAKESQVLTAGCVELGERGGRMELNVNTAGDGAFCLHPAFEGRGNPGIYIPASCDPTPSDELEVVGSQVPTQGASGYGLVIWGYVPGSETVAARYAGTEVDAAVFPAPESVSPEGMRLFVMELPREAACEKISVRDNSGNEDQTFGDHKVCEAGS